jgi:hypothetical protein
MAISSASKKIYRSRVKRSVCRKGKKNSEKCKRLRGCKTASGTKRRFCRKIHNSTIRRR